MVEGDDEGGDVADRDFVADRGGRAPHPADAEDGTLRRVQHGREPVHAERGQVADCEGRALEIRHGELARLGPVGEVGRGGRDLAEAELSGIAQHRHHQPVLDIDRYSQIDLPIAADLAIDEGRVERRMLLQRGRDRLQEDVVERGDKAVGGAPFAAVGIAEGAHVGHVDVDAFRHLRRAGPMGAEALCRHPPNGGQRDDIVLGLAGRLLLQRRGGARVDGALHVLLGDAAAGAGAVQPVRVHAMPFRQPAGDGRDALLVRHRLGRGDRLVRPVRQVLAALADPGERCADRVFPVHLRVYAQQHAAGRRLDIDRRLVGLDGIERRALFDRSAFGRIPFHDLAALHGVAERSEPETDRHQAMTFRTAFATALASGTVTFTSSSANGMGTCGLPTRTIGARKS